MQSMEDAEAKVLISLTLKMHVQAADSGDEGKEIPNAVFLAHAIWTLQKTSGALPPDWGRL